MGDTPTVPTNDTPQAGMPGQAASAAVTPQAQTPIAPAATVAPANAPAPAQAPAQGTTPTPSTTQSGLPGAPTADASAVATAHPTSILRGALMGILGAASKVGHAVGSELKTINAGGHVAQANTKIAQQGEIQRQQQAQQAAKDAQQKAQDEHIAAGDTHSEMPLRMNILSNTAVGTALSNSIQQQNLSQTQVDNTLKNNAEAAKIVQLLKDEGVPVEDEHGVGFDNLGPQHAQDITNGQVVALNNGQTGDGHGIVLVRLAQAEKTPLTKDRQVVTDYKVDSKTGAMEPVYSTLPAGTSTVMDVLNAQAVASQKFDEKSKIAAEIQKQQLNAADIAAKEGEAFKAE